MSSILTRQLSLLRTDSLFLCCGVPFLLREPLSIAQRDSTAPTERSDDGCTHKSHRSGYYTRAQYRNPEIISAEDSHERESFRLQNDGPCGVHSQDPLIDTQTHRPVNCGYTLTPAKTDTSHSVFPPQESDQLGPEVKWWPHQPATSAARSVQPCPPRRSQSVRRWMQPSGPASLSSCRCAQRAQRRLSMRPRPHCGRC